MNALTSYRKNGHDFSLVIRSGDIAIFHGRSLTGQSETFEVIHVQRHNGREIAGAFLPPAEFPPSNNQWGSKGWTYPDKASAETKFETLKSQ